MRKPLRLLLAGLTVFLVGVAIGAFNIDPLSAWIGTLGMAIAVVGLAWLIVLKRRRRAS
jgi:heme O synthase-like polyprenyltransferase